VHKSRPDDFYNAFQWHPLNYTLDGTCSATAALHVPAAPTALVDSASMDKQCLWVSEQSVEPSKTSARATRQTV